MAVCGVVPPAAQGRGVGGGDGRRGGGYDDLDMSPGEKQREAKSVEERIGGSVYSVGPPSVEQPVRRLTSADCPLQCL